MFFKLLPQVAKYYKPQGSIRTNYYNRHTPFEDAAELGGLLLLAAAPVVAGGCGIVWAFFKFMEYKHDTLQKNIQLKQAAAPIQGGTQRDTNKISSHSNCVEEYRRLQDAAKVLEIDTSKLSFNCN